MCRHWTSCQPAAQCKPAEASSPCTRCSRCETQRCIAAQQGTSCLLLELASRHWRAITPAATHRQPSATAPPDSDVDDQYLSTIAIRRHIPTITFQPSQYPLSTNTCKASLLHSYYCISMQVLLAPMSTKTARRAGQQGTKQTVHPPPIFWYKDTPFKLAQKTKYAIFNSNSGVKRKKRKSESQKSIVPFTFWAQMGFKRRFCFKSLKF